MSKAKKIYEQRCENCLELNQTDKPNRIVECFNCGITFNFKDKYVVGKPCTCCWCNDDILFTN